MMLVLSRSSSLDLSPCTGRQHGLFQTYRFSDMDYRLWTSRTLLDDIFDLPDHPQGHRDVQSGKCPPTKGNSKGILRGKDRFPSFGGRHAPILLVCGPKVAEWVPIRPSETDLLGTENKCRKSRFRWFSCRQVPWNAVLEMVSAFYRAFPVVLSEIWSILNPFARFEWFLIKNSGTGTLERSNFEHCWSTVAFAVVWAISGIFCKIYVDHVLLGNRNLWRKISVGEISEDGENKVIELKCQVWDENALPAKV